MPRTVDQIVACHVAATELRKAGKPIWPKKINIKAILQEDPSNVTPEHIAAVSQRIAKLIRSSAPQSFFDVGHEDYDFDFIDAIENLENCTAEVLAEDAANGSDAECMFNGWLEGIYDWADRNRIWLGR